MPKYAIKPSNRAEPTHLDMIPLSREPLSNGVLIAEGVERFLFPSPYDKSPDEVPQVYRERTTRFMADQLLDLPLFIIHGSADEVIPVHHSRLLAEKLGERYRSLEIEGGNHDSPIYISLEPAFDFILSTMGVTNPG